jgi:hypothetical protein
MRKCHVCGLEVDDRTYICPDCGAEIVGSSGGLSLKAGTQEVKKKTGSSLGTTVSTGSGLTDILRGDDDVEDFGSMPAAISYDLTDYETNKKAKRHFGKSIFKLICVAALAFGLYMLITQVFLKKTGPETYMEALETYIEAINNSDQDKMEFVIPPVYENKESTASEALSKLDGVSIDNYEVEDKYFLNSDEISTLQDSIKYATTKTANMSDVVNIKLRISGKLGSLVSSGATNGEITVQVVHIRNSWYVLPEEFEDIKFN